MGSSASVPTYVHDGSIYKCCFCGKELGYFGYEVESLGILRPEAYSCTSCASERKASSLSQPESCSNYYSDSKGQYSHQYNGDFCYYDSGMMVWRNRPC
eukprot:gene11019-12010_t